MTDPSREGAIPGLAMVARKFPWHGALGTARCDESQQGVALGCEGGGCDAFGYGELPPLFKSWIWNNGPNLFEL